MLGGIIVLIVIIYIVRNNNKKSGNVNNRLNYPNMNNTMQNRPVQNAAVQNRPMQNRPVQNTQNANKSVQNTSSQTTSGGQKKASVTEYLGQKAAEDQKEHAIEAFEQQKRMQKKYGSMPVAGRYILGDPVPKSCQLVYCSYCGAENIVKMGYHGGMSCYFCRTGL